MRTVAPQPTLTVAARNLYRSASFAALEAMDPSRDAVPNPALTTQMQPIEACRRSHPRNAPVLALAIILALLGSLGASGCASNRFSKMRRNPVNPLTRPLALDSWQGPNPTERTIQMLRRHDLTEKLDGDPRQLVDEMLQITTLEPSADHVYATAEVAYIGAKKLEQDQRLAGALDLYSATLANAYFYLFDPILNRERNPYDPRFRQACNLYNEALEAVLRYAARENKLRPGGRVAIETDQQSLEITVATRGTWHEENFKELKFVSDFDVKELKNHYRAFGLGVPMIAVYQSGQGSSPSDRFYPPGMSFPVTAFLRVEATSAEARAPGRMRHNCVVELHDPTLTSEILVGGHAVPLETDLTTPLAYSLDNEAFKRANVPTQGLRRPEASNAVAGLYLLEPYNPQKIPVVMVHGFWSSLVTWMEMFNDLRGSPDILDAYQFWFYLYPTGPPFWYTAAHLRQELHDARELLDPDRRTPTLDHMVLVGHSMGGLIAKMQTIESGNRFWNLLTEQPPGDLRANQEIRYNLARTLFFQPNPSIRRVVTIASPLKGSNFANLTTQWLGRKLINLPEELVEMRAQLLRENPGMFPENSLLNITTSIDSLAPTSPILPALYEAPPAPWVTYHNIIGLVDDRRVLGAIAAGSDGIVTWETANDERAASQITVPAEHTSVHQQSQAILEVRRILQLHLSQLRANPPDKTANHQSLTQAANSARP